MSPHAHFYDCKAMFRYKIVFNHSGRLDRQGDGLVSIEVRGDGRRTYFSTGVRVKPYQWDTRSSEVVNHPLADEYREYLLNTKYALEKIELCLRNRGQDVSLARLRQAYRYNVKPDATVREFTSSVVDGSDRSPQTKNAYRTMVTALEEFQKDLKVSDVSHDMIERWRASMKQQGLSDNTVKGRLKQLHCITQEAIKRDLISSDPFKWITIGNMTPKKEYLSMADIRRIERIRLTGREERVRDLFLLSCYSGLRYSDLTTLEDATISGGILRKRMVKTKLDVFIPVGTLFWGKGMEIIERYQPITRLSRCVKCNSTANRMIKDIAKRAGVTMEVHFHLARKSFSSLLFQMGIPMQDISVMLGHSKLETTQKFYVFGKETTVEKNIKKVFK